MTSGRRTPSNWRDYQTGLRRSTRLKTLLKRLLLPCLILGCVSLVLGVLFFSKPRVLFHRTQGDHEVSKPEEPRDVGPQSLSDQDLSEFLQDLAEDSKKLSEQFVMEKEGALLTVRTSIDASLQKYVTDLLGKSKTLKAAAVVMSPGDGRILALASYERAGNGENLCLKADFPAASLFKIVSAAAALEVAGFTPERPVFYRGKKHTLYKSQLAEKEKGGRFTSKTSFRRAFAISINSVFGKLGIYDLGKETMSEYAGKFLFNKTIPFDLPLEVSTIEVPEDPFGLAEISSGFNKRTHLSPLHAALLASAVANNGDIMRPWVIESIYDEAGVTLYRVQPKRLVSPMNTKTAADLRSLMRETVLYGTCRKPFGSLRRKKALKNVELGAKTGTINNKSDTLKFDWLTTYALPPEIPQGICLGVLAVHGEKLGVRSTELARHIIYRYFTK